MYRILLTDDDETILTGIRMYFQEQTGYELLTANTREQALNLIDTNEFDAVIVDLLFPDSSDGLAVIRSSCTQSYRPTILAMTAYDTVENAVAMMRAGADDFVAKGFGLDELMIRIKNLLKRKKEIYQLTIENEILHQTLRQQFNDYQIIGQSPQIKELMNKVKKIAEDGRVTCLIEGESGSGKDLIARTIHTSSNRCHAPFIPINCAAIPDNLLENELFGHEKGAFTGAYSNQQGKFEQANDGVLFLDEISELPMPLQVVLLRVLEEKEIYRIGGKRPIPVNVMILAASNQDLEQLVHNDNFREDLFFRLNVIKIKIPPLREHPQDIEPLACFFLKKFNRERNKQLSLTTTTLSLLKSYSYPGNVRELRNIIEDAFVFCTGQTIKPSDLRINQNHNYQFNRSIRILENITSGVIFKAGYQEAIRKFAKMYFIQLLGKNRWNIKESARQAGISREWLSKKIRKLEIKRA